MKGIEIFPVFALRDLRADYAADLCTACFISLGNNTGKSKLSALLVFIPSGVLILP